MMSLLILLAVGWKLGGATDTQRSHMYTNVGLNNKAFTDNVVFESSAKTAPHCALQCNQQDSCMAFTFEDKICRGHAAVMTSRSNSRPAVGARSFYKGNNLHRPVDCTDVQRYSNVSGVHTLYIGNTSFPVYCDQDTDGGGWTVFQRRQDGSVNFTRLYREFETGFGDPHGEFWLGLKNIHQLTSQAEYDLRVDMEDFEHNSTYALYNNFRIADGTDKYRLHLGSLVTGPSASTNHMSYNDGYQFSALGNDNFGCVATRRGTGWWFGGCTYVNPNGLYLHGYEALASGDTESKIIWNSFRGHHYSLKRIEMKVRRHIR